MSRIGRKEKAANADEIRERMRRRPLSVLIGEMYGRPNRTLPYDIALWMSLPRMAPGIGNA